MTHFNSAMHGRDRRKSQRNLLKPVLYSFYPYPHLETFFVPLDKLLMNTKQIGYIHSIRWPDSCST